MPETTITVSEMYAREAQAAANWAAREKRAVAAERERCAKAAESCATKDGEDWHNNPGQGAWDNACESIAARIRSGE